MKTSITPRLFCLATLLSVVCANVSAAPQRVSSGVQQVQLVELYTSEGCSSCPPADRRLSRELKEKTLWQERVPVAFHVDYWDYIGWADPYAAAEHSQRQRAHQRQGNLSTVYTPAFVVDGQEWRGFFRGGALPALTRQTVGPLSLQYDEGEVAVAFDAAEPGKASLRLQLAWLGTGIETAVKRGENRGKKLAHDFVVLRWQSDVLHPDEDYRKNVRFPADHLADAERYALVAWLEDPRTGRAVQAAGGWVTP